MQSTPRSPRGAPAQHFRVRSACERPASRHQTLGMDEQQEHRVRLLLLGKGAVLAHRFERQRAAALDDDQEPGGDACFSAKEQSWGTAWRTRSPLSRTKLDSAGASTPEPPESSPLRESRPRTEA